MRCFRIVSLICVVAAVLFVALIAQPRLASANVLMWADLPAWKTAVGTWQETTNFGVPDGTTVSGVTLKGATLGFGAPYSVRGIGDPVVGSGWATWCCGYTGQVVFGGIGTTSETWSVSPTNGLGMFIEPNTFSTFAISLSTDAGTSLTEQVAGFAGAQFFGWTGQGVKGITIVGTDPNGFAEGDFFVTPEPSSGLLMGSVLPVLAGLGGVVRRRRRNNA